jgi:long-chain acyl-CoA synthetase
MSSAATERPWLKHYEAGVPADVDIPDCGLPSFLSESSAQYPDRVAIRFFGRSMTYRELDAAANRFANVLIALGVRKGERVGLFMPNCPQMVIAYYGGLRAGAVLVPTSPLYVESELEHQLADADVSVIVSLSALFPRIQAVRARLPSLRHVLVTNIKDYFPKTLRLLFTLSKERKDGHRVRLPRDGQTHNMTRMMGLARAVDPGVAIGGDDLALLQYTGGTTGLAKGAMLSHRNLVANAVQVRAWFQNMASDGAPDIVMGVLPLFHIYAMSSVMNFSIRGAGTMVLQPRFVLEDVLKGIHREHAQILPGQRREGSIGVPLPSTDAAIFDVDVEGMRRLGVGETGELAVRGPQVMQGYWKRPDETANVMRDGWLLTGDVARMDADGYFSIVDRKKDMIITGGMNVYPRDVEEPLYQHPKVREAVAVGLPDQRWGEAVKVYIVLKDGQSATEQEIVEYCQARMARFKVPKYVEFRPELPKTLVGKFLRRKLLEEEQLRASRTASRAS